MYKGASTGIAIVTIFLLNGCAMVGPDYNTPTAQTSSTWNTDGTGVETNPTQDAVWWKNFNDSVLSHLIEIGYRNNLTLQSAGVKVLQARAQLAQSVGELYPQQQAISTNYTRQRVGGSNQYASLLPTNLETNSASIGASWEPDFWGQYRRAIRANDANFLASLASYDNALISLTADIGASYITIRTYQSQLAVTEKSIAVLEQSLQLTKTRYHHGQVSLSEVEQINTTLNQTKSTLPTLRASLEVEKNALAVLLGTTPDKIDALLKSPSRTQATIPTAPTTIAVGIPKDILRQRPDVYQAELQAIAQCEEIGAIKAQLYPAFTLSGSFGYSSSNSGNSSTKDIFQWANHTYSIGPSLNIPIFNYGQITNQVRTQDAIFQQSILNYQNIVLNAQKEVQDGIFSYVESEKTLKSMTAANDAALQTLQLTIARYEAGQVDYLDVLNVEETQLGVQSALVNAQSNVPQGAISLYRALGGGWQIRQGRDVVPNKIKKEMAKRTNWGDLLKTENHQAPTNKHEKFEQNWMPD